MDNSAILVREQVKDLQKRTRAAIRQNNDALTLSLVMEYTKLIASAIGATGSNVELINELLLLQAESSTIPPKSKDDPSIQLKWLDNSISKLKMIIQKPSQTTTNLEIRLHPRVITASRKLLQDKHYPQAIFEAFKALEEYVREKSGVKDRSGKDLMTKVFL